MFGRCEALELAVGGGFIHRDQISGMSSAFWGSIVICLMGRFVRVECSKWEPAGGSIYDMYGVLSEWQVLHPNMGARKGVGQLL